MGLWKHHHDTLGDEGACRGCELDREYGTRQMLQGEIGRLSAAVERLTREAEWAHRGWDDAREHADQHEKESDALRALVAQLVGALDDLQDHHCGGMCARDHERVMDKVNAVLAAAAPYLPPDRPPG